MQNEKLHLTQVVLRIETRKVESSANFTYVYIKMFVKCICYNGRVDQKSRCPFHGIVMRLLVSPRINMSLPDSGWICNGCRMCHLRWRNNSEFANVLHSLEDESNEKMNDDRDKVGFGENSLILHRTYYLF